MEKLKSFLEHNESFDFKLTDELDMMSEHDIKEYRYAIIQNNAGWSDAKNISKLRKAQADWKQYLEELEVYNLVRFKDKQMDIYDKWIEKADAGDKDYELMGGIAKREGGKKGLYDMSLTYGINKVGTFKYLQFDIPETNLDIEKLFRDK